MILLGDQRNQSNRNCKYKCTFKTLQDKKYSKLGQIAMKGCPLLLPGKKVMLAATWRFVIKFTQGTL